MVFFVNISKYPDSYEKIITKILFGIATDRFYEPGIEIEKMKTGFNKKGNKQYIYQSGFVVNLTKIEYKIPDICTKSEYGFKNGVLYKFKTPEKFEWTITDYAIIGMGKNNSVIIYDDKTFNIKKPFGLIEDLKSENYGDYLLDPYIYTRSQNIYEYIYKLVVDLYPETKKLTFKPPFSHALYKKIPGDLKNVSGTCDLSGATLFGKILTTIVQGKKMNFNLYCIYSAEFYEMFKNAGKPVFNIEFADKSYSDILPEFTTPEGLQKCAELEMTKSSGFMAIGYLFEFLNHIRTNDKMKLIFIYN